MQTPDEKRQFHPSQASMIQEEQQQRKTKRKKNYWTARTPIGTLSASPDAGVAAGGHPHSGSTAASVKDFRRPRTDVETRSREVGGTDSHFSQRCTMEAPSRDGGGRRREGVYGGAFQPLDHAGASYRGRQAPSGWELGTVKESSSHAFWKEAVHPDHSPLHAIPKAYTQTSRTEVNAWGQRIGVTVTKEASVVQGWIGRQCGKLFGFDVEWRPNFQKGSNNKVALLQLCGERECLIVQMLFLDRKPNALVQFLLDPEKTLGGVNILSDTKKLQEDHGLACAGVLELRTFAARMLTREDLKHTGLKQLVKELLGLDMPKPKSITMSNWANRTLDLAQVNYACVDAWVSFAILSYLMACNP